MQLKLNETYHGFQLIDEKYIEENNSTGRLFAHVKTGAKLYYLSNDDDNKVFSITFKTPPADSTGLPHILEHSVLCGSRKYPVKEPFVELIKGSLNTFLNAMTFPDKTMYPVASKNEKDFENLMDVYLDAVFYPRIYDHKEIFFQEGWHYHIEDENEDITYNGVVYNEMKGAFSNPEDVLGRKVQESLFPDTPYGKESGGDPDEIPNLKYEDFISFHKKYYHPSNSYIYLYGDGDVLAHLKYLDENYLSSFDFMEIDSEIPVQESFEAQKEISFNYPVGEAEDLKEKTFLSLNYVTDRCTDGEIHLALDILTHILTDAQSSPLNKALLDAQIGQDVGGYYDGSILQPVFSIVVKNSDEDKVEKFKKVVQTTLEGLVKSGLEEDMVEGAINITEFKLREADHGSYPKGLIFGIEIMESWLHGQDPSIHLRYQGYIDKIRQESKSGYFERLIKKYLLDNPHSSLVVLKPEKALAIKRDEEVKKHLGDVKSRLSKSELKKLVDETNRLIDIQNAPDRKEDIDKIPVLPVTSIKREHEKIPLEKRQFSKADVLYHPLDTNGINYVDIYFDVSHISKEEIPYLSLLTRYLGEAGTKSYDYVKLNNVIEIHTGGIDFDLDVFGNVNDPDEFSPKFAIKSRSLETKTKETFELIEEMVLSTRFDERQRLKEVVQSIKSKMEMDFMTVGHKVVSGRVMSYLSDTSQYVEHMAGIEFYRFISALFKEFDSKWEETFDRLKNIAERIFDINGITASVTGDEKGYASFKESFSLFYDKLTDFPKEKADLTFEKQPLNEGIATPGKVLYVGKAYNFKKLGFDYTGAMQVVKVIMSTDYLWNKVRVQGGAYGAFFSVGKNGSLFLGSYRDPNLTATLNIFDKAYEYLKNFEGSDADMNKYIIGTMSGIDTPMTPGMKGSYSTGNYFRNVTDEMIQKEREEILSCSAADVKAASDVIKLAMDKNYLCVLGDEGKIKSEKDIFGTIINIFE